MSIPSGGLDQQYGLNQVLVGGKERITNPRFSGTTNGWTATTSATATSAGVSLSGEGDFYQTLNTSDVVSGQLYMARILVTAISGVITLQIGLTQGGTQAVDQALSLGWNVVKFTAGATNIFNIDVASGASCTIQECHVNDAVDMFVTGTLVTF